MRQSINRNMLRAAMEYSQGQFFAVKFTKKDGSERLMAVKSRVNYKGVGGKNTTAHIDKYVTVWEFGKYPKNVNLDTVSELRMNGKVYHVA